MRVNVYHEELTGETTVVEVAPTPDRRFIGVRFMLKSPSELHSTLQDDDRSAVTFWLGTKREAIDFFEDALFQLRKLP